MSRNRHKKPPDDTPQHSNLVDAFQKYAPGQRTLVTRLGTSKSENLGEVDINTYTIAYRRFPVAWGVPMDELGYSYWFSKFMQQDIMPWDPLIFCLNTYLPEARSFIHETFVNMPEEVKYLVMLDSDVIPPEGSVAKLIKYKKPLVGGWYPKKSEKPEERHPVVYDFKEIDADGKAMWRSRKEIGTGLERVDGAGAGFWVMRRDVAEAIGPRPYDFLRCGEDLEMCLKVREAGFDIYIDWDLKAEHRGVFSI